MPKKRALIIVKTEPPVREETEWNNWYDNEHIPDRLGIPGFLSARRFIRIGDESKGFITKGEPKYITLYDINSTDVLKSEPYLKLKEREASLPSDSFVAVTKRLTNFTRGVYEQIYPKEGEYKPPHTKFVFLVGHDVPQNREEEFNAWYDTEHVPGVLKVPGFLTGRRFRLAEGEFSPTPSSKSLLSTFLTLYDIDNESVFESDAFKKAAESPWSDWVRSWYTKRMRMLYRRIYPKE